MKAKTLAKTLGHVDSESLLDTVAELQVKKRADTVCDVKAFAPVEVLSIYTSMKKFRRMPRHPERCGGLTHWSRRWLTG